jgi:spore maturation protein SpmA
MSDTNIIPLTEVRENIGELVNRAYYNQGFFGVSKGKKFMGAFVSADIWKEMIRVVEEHNQGLADTLAVMADPELQKLFEEGEQDARNGNTISLEQLKREMEEEE